MQVGDHLPEAAWQDQSAVRTAMASCGEAPCLLALSRQSNSQTTPLHRL